MAQLKVKSITRVFHIELNEEEARYLMDTLGRTTDVGLYDLFNELTDLFESDGDD